MDALYQFGYFSPPYGRMWIVVTGLFYAGTLALNLYCWRKVFAGNRRNGKAVALLLYVLSAAMSFQSFAMQFTSIHNQHPAHRLALSFNLGCLLFSGFVLILSRRGKA